MDLSSPTVPSNLGFYLIGAILILLGIAFFLMPLLGRVSGGSGLKIPWIILYTYNKGGFYFVTSPILIIISAIVFIFYLLRR